MIVLQKSILNNLLNKETKMSGKFKNTIILEDSHLNSFKTNFKSGPPFGNMLKLIFYRGYTCLLGYTCPTQDHPCIHTLSILLHSKGTIYVQICFNKWFLPCILSYWSHSLINFPYKSCELLMPFIAKLWNSGYHSEFCLLPDIQTKQIGGSL